MSETNPPHKGQHLLGMVAAFVASGLIVALLSYGLDYLNGTPLAELRYVVFVVVAVGLLSGLQSIFSRFTP